MSSLQGKHIVCLGGGIGTVNLLKGLKHYGAKLTVIVSMADEGGSSGRLKRLYNVFPSGDLISCMAALTSNEAYANLLTYRFPGNRYGNDTALSGHKLGNLMMVAAQNTTSSFQEAIDLLRKMTNTKGAIFPATAEHVRLSALTVDGTKVEGEENIDLGKYNGKRVLDKISLAPKNPKVPEDVIAALSAADIIIVGPGDLYTTLLPVLIIPKIAEAFLAAKATKLFVVNVANKPFETKGYNAADFIKAVEKHLGTFPFHKVITNNNYSAAIPKKFHYTYVKQAPSQVGTVSQTQIVQADLINTVFPLYHDPEKLAKTIAGAV